VGKSCLIKRYCEQKFISRYISTIGVDFGVRPVVLDLPPTRSGGNSTNDSLEVRVNFWDLSGDPDFADVRTEFYEHTQAMLLVYDVTARASFENLEKWLREAEKHGARPLITVVAANKADDDAAGPQRQVSEEEGRRWAAAHSIGYYETSAKSGHDGTSSTFIRLSSSSRICLSLNVILLRCSRVYFCVFVIAFTSAVSLMFSELLQRTVAKLSE